MIVGDIGGNRTRIKMVLQTIPYANIGYDAYGAADDFNPTGRYGQLINFDRSIIRLQLFVVGFLI